MDNSKEYERKCIELAFLMFPGIDETVDDLEIKYPERNLKQDAFVTRFAPSPTGFLHTGALFTSLINKKLANQSEGRFFLRIEDTDRKREVEGSVDLLTKEMQQFKIVPDEGVITGTKEVGAYGPYTQSKRENIYKTCAKYLVEKGLAYPCFCTPEMMEKTRKMQEENKIVPGYYGIYARCRNISIDESIERVKNGEKFIVRFRSNGSHLKKTSFVDAIRGKIEIAENDQDVVIIKSDGLPTYHFAHVVDDHFMRTTHVIRGEEWIPSTPIHLQLFEAMGFKAPTYVHLPTIMIKEGNSKRKLSKRKDKEAAVSYFLKAGYPVDAVLEYLLTIINSDFETWRNKNKDLDYNDFVVRLKKVSISGALFDIQKLNDVSKENIARMNSKQVLDNVLDWTKKYDHEFYEMLNSNLDFAQKMFAMERDNAKKIRKDIIKWEDIKPTYFYFFDKLYEDDLKEKGYMFEVIENNTSDKITKDVVKEVLKNYLNEYKEDFSKEEWFENMKNTASRLNFCVDMKIYKQNKDKYKGSISDFAGIIRMAVTNRKNTPDIYYIMQLLGIEKVEKRINDALNSL